MLETPVKQSAVNGMGDGFGHGGGVHDHLLCAGLVDNAVTQGRLDSGRQQCLHTSHILLQRASYSASSRTGRWANWFASWSRHRSTASLGPVDQRGQSDQRVLHVELLEQHWTQQLTALWLGRLRPHGTPRRNLQKTGAGKTIPCNSCAHQSSTEVSVRSMDCRLFRAD